MRGYLFEFHFSSASQNELANENDIGRKYVSTNLIIMTTIQVEKNNIERKNIRMNPIDRAKHVEMDKPVGITFIIFLNDRTTGHKINY